MKDTTKESKKYRNWAFTFPNYPNTELVDNIECRYIGYAHEIAPTTGTPHLQGFICFYNATTYKSVIKQMPGCHVEHMKGSMRQNETYCSKESKLIERGDKPVTNDDKGRANQLRWQRTRELAKEGKLDDVDADIYVQHYNTLKRIQMDHAQRPEVRPETSGIWIYGKSGVGKTKLVFEQYPDHYVKSRNKWWSSYTGQDVVVCDDVGLEDAKWMGSFLKDWAGQYPFQAETKGSSMIIRPRLFVVTSQYSIEDLWYDQETRDALNRRFTVNHMS